MFLFVFAFMRGFVSAKIAADELHRKQAEDDALMVELKGFKCSQYIYMLIPTNKPLI